MYTSLDPGLDHKLHHGRERLEVSFFLLMVATFSPASTSTDDGDESVFLSVS